MTRKVQTVPIHGTKANGMRLRAGRAHPSRRAEGLTPLVNEALSLFIPSLKAAYGSRLAFVSVFGSRARGDAGPNSDVDVAVLLEDAEVDTYKEKMVMADLAYDAIVETGIYVQPWPVSTKNWNNPANHANPALIRAMQGDGRALELLP